MNIWIVNPFDTIPGEGMRPGRYWSLSNILANRGHRVVWWSSDFSHVFKQKRSLPSGEKFEMELVRTRPYYSHVGIARLINHRQFGTGFLRLAKDHLKKKKLRPPDRIVVSLPPLSTQAGAFAIRSAFGGRVVLDIQDAWPETFYRLVPGNGPISKAFARIVFSPWRLQAERAFAGADAISAVSKTYLGIAGVRERGIPWIVTPIGTDLAKLKKFAVKKAGKPGETVFVYIGSMSANYDLETVVRAAARLRQNGRRFKILIAGKGPMEDRLKNMAESMNLGGIVRFKGFLGFEKLAALLGRADVSINPVFPNSVSAIPNKIGDYLGAGLPVVNSIPGELSDMIAENGCGRDYTAGNADSLAKVMAEYIDSENMAEIQGTNAARPAEILFDRNRTYPDLARFIEKI